MLSTSRAASRRLATLRLPSITHSSTARRALSTAPPAAKSRSWKSSAVRWGLAGAGVWYYNTSSVFAEEEEAAIQRTEQSLHALTDAAPAPTVDALVAEKRARRAREEQSDKEKYLASQPAAAAAAGEGASASTDTESAGLEGLEDEADQQGAFNPETGEINWDCPCLGGMAHGPCGDEFRAAFSCFVYSTEEPKGMECIEKFKGMQDCFRAHPEHYGAELEDDDEDDEGMDVDGAGDVHVQDTAGVEGDASRAPKESVDGEFVADRREGSETGGEGATEKTSAHDPVPRGAEKGDEGGELVPKAAFDASAK